MAVAQLDASSWPWPVLVLVLTCAWALLHAAAPAVLRLVLSQMGVPGISRQAEERLPEASAERQRTLRRMVRAQCYYVVAGPLGVWLLWQNRTLDDLNHRYTPAHERAFALALSHWIVSLVEDAVTPSGFKVGLGPGGKGRILDLYRLYLLHHLAAIAAFASCLCTASLPALGACGLCFELPVIFVNLRDLLRGFEPELRWFKPLGGWHTVDVLWATIALAVVPGRRALPHHALPPALPPALRRRPEARPTVRTPSPTLCTAARLAALGSRPHRALRVRPHPVVGGRGGWLHAASHARRVSAAHAHT